jgi:hypothetical protein
VPFSTATPRDVALAGWGLGHGLVSLYLDRKLTAPSSTAIAAQVRASFLAAFQATQRA